MITTNETAILHRMMVCDVGVTALHDFRRAYACALCTQQPHTPACRPSCVQDVKCSGGAHTLSRSAWAISGIHNVALCACTLALRRSPVPLRNVQHACAAWTPGTQASMGRESLVSGPAASTPPLAACSLPSLKL
jgi:hypothetical protein